MPDNEELEEFLKGNAESVPTDPAPEADAPAQPPTEGAKSETPPQEAEEAEPNDGPLVPVKALQDERSKRNDWKEKALRAEGEMATLKARYEAELAALKQPPTPKPAPQSQEFPPAPNPAEDPAGYAAWQRQADFNYRANISEKAMRADRSITDLDAKLASFQQARAADPHLEAMLYIQPDPWRWAYDQGVRIDAERAAAEKRAAAMSEIGDDPAAFRERLRQEIMAELQQQTPSAVQRRAPAPPQFQSLAGSRSVQGRGEPVAEEQSVEDMFPN